MFSSGTTSRVTFEPLPIYLMVLDTLTNHIKTDTPWEIVFADDIAIVDRTEEDLQGKLTKWQMGLANGGLKMSAEKSETMVMERKQV